MHASLNEKARTSRIIALRAVHKRHTRPTMSDHATANTPTLSPASAEPLRVVEAAAA